MAGKRSRRVVGAAAGAPVCLCLALGKEMTISDISLPFGRQVALPETGLWRAVPAAR